MALILYHIPYKSLSKLIILIVLAIIIIINLIIIFFIHKFINIILYLDFILIIIAILYIKYLFIKAEIVGAVYLNIPRFRHWPFIIPFVGLALFIFITWLISATSLTWISLASVILTPFISAFFVVLTQSHYRYGIPTHIIRTKKWRCSRKSQI